jgi:hypothetical protein
MAALNALIDPSREALAEASWAETVSLSLIAAVVAPEASSRATGSTLIGIAMIS